MAHQRVQAPRRRHVDTVRGARREDDHVAGRQREAGAVAEALTLACTMRLHRSRPDAIDARKMPGCLHKMKGV